MIQKIASNVTRVELVLPAKADELGQVQRRDANRVPASCCLNGIEPLNY
jgi:hypothetical protein